MTKFSDKGNTLSLPRSRPENEGVAPSGVLDFFDRIDSLRFVHSFILMRHGKVIAEAWRTPYSPDTPHELYSLTKSFVSVAFGMALDRGLVRYDDKLVSFFPDMPHARGVERLTLRHLLTMTTGQEGCPVFTHIVKNGIETPSWGQAFLSSPPVCEPGTKFFYNSGATYMLSNVLKKVLGEDVEAFLGRELFLPLNITPPKWEKSPENVSIGAWGLALTTEDVAKFGQLLLNKGVWNGKRLVSAEYLEEATKKQVDNSDNPDVDWRIGYGYHFWMCRHNGFRGDGMAGQYVFILPDFDLVLAVTSGMPTNVQKIPDAFFDCILPAVGRTQNLSVKKEIMKKFLSWSMPMPQGNLSLRRPDEKYVFTDAEDNVFESVSLSFSSDCVKLDFVRKDGRTESLKAGFGHYEKSCVKLFDIEANKAAGTGAWKDTSTLVIEVVFYETPFTRTLTLSFGNGTLTLEENSPIRFLRSAAPKLTGILCVS